MNIDTRQLTQAGLISYLTLVVAAFVTGNSTFRLAADAAFGLTVVLLSVVTLRIPVDSQLKYIVGDGFLFAGVSQLVELAASAQSVGLANTLFPLTGLLGYLALHRETDAMPF